MQLWTFHRYRRPQLCVDTIEHGDRMVTLHAGSQCYRLAFDDSAAAAQIATELASLRDPDAPLWHTLRASTPDSAWHKLGTFLDTRSLIRESSDDAARALSMQEKRVQNHINGTYGAVMDGLIADQRSQIAALATQLTRDIDRTLAAQTSFFKEGDPFDAAVQPNFYLGLLAIEFEYLRHVSPPTLAAARLLLQRICASDVGGDTDALSETCNLYDEHDLASHLWLIGQCLARSVGNTATRFPTAAIPNVALSCGLEFMRRTELLTRETLSLWGPNRYVMALETLDDAGPPLIAGPFIEQYHVTRRFVEIIAPLLSQRLSPPLRRQMFQYYSEEVGHEALESTTCEALGVTQRALDLALPLPLHFAFVDALTVVAQLDPITSFAAIMAIEGVFGEPPRMSMRLAAVGKSNPVFREVSQEHDDLNDTLNHNSIARDCFEHVSAVSSARQLAAMRRILFLLELNHRAWDGIANFYGAQKTLMLYGPCGEPMAPNI